MYSAFPLFGLHTNVSIIRKTQKEDAAKAYYLGTPHTTIYSNLKVRFTVITEDLNKQLPVGKVKSDEWLVISKYIPNVNINDYILMPSGLPYPAGYYEILWYEHKQDHLGKLHHTSLIVELDDSD